MAYRPQAPHDCAGSKNRSRSWILPTVVAILLGSGGCAGNGGDAGSSPPVTGVPSADPVPAASSPDQASAASTPTAAPAKRTGALKLGEKRRLDNGEVLFDIVVLDHRSGKDYEGVLVRSCNRGSAEIGVSRGPWTLGYDDFDSLHDGDILGGGLPAPVYPYLEDRYLKKGECAKGWINYSSIPGQHPDGVQYAPDGVEPVRWTF